MGVNVFGLMGRRWRTVRAVHVNRRDLFCSGQICATNAVDCCAAADAAQAATYATEPGTA